MEMKHIIILSVVVGLLASVYNMTHINYQIECRTLADMTVKCAVVHLKWEHGVLGTPWQYRPFEHFVTEWLSPKSYLKINDRVYGTHYSPYVAGAMKFVVITAMFVLFAFYYRKLGIGSDRILIGLFIAFLVYIIGVSNETIRLNTYLEICFYLFVSLIILNGKSWLYILAIIPIAAFNRETCFFIPWIMVSWYFFHNAKAREYLKPAILLLIWAVIFIGIRKYYPVQTVHNFGHNGCVMGWSTIKANMTDINSLALWLVFPITAGYLFLSKRKFMHPYLLQGVALPMLALTALDFYGGTINEICVFEVPIFIFLIPMFLTNNKGVAI
jgi:hypothetical protein